MRQTQEGTPLTSGGILGQYGGHTYTRTHTHLGFWQRMEVATQECTNSVKEGETAPLTGLWKASQRRWDVNRVPEAGAWRQRAHVMPQERKGIPEQAGLGKYPGAEEHVSRLRLSDRRRTTGDKIRNTRAR